MINAYYAWCSSVDTTFRSYISIIPVGTTDLFCKDIAFSLVLNKFTFRAGALGALSSLISVTTRVVFSKMHLQETLNLSHRTCETCRQLVSMGLTFSIAPTLGIPVDIKKTLLITVPFVLWNASQIPNE